MLRLVVRSAFAGLAALGAVVMALGGASRGLVATFWALGFLVVVVRDFIGARLSRFDEPGRSA